jgi:DMSO/TMAO reductase YedYZ molybdopterin-dependent catalytic subunit
VIFGLETTLSVLEGVGFNIKDTAKVTEEALAITSLFVAGWLTGAVFFAVAVGKSGPRVKRAGVMTGGALGLFTLVILLLDRPTAGFLSTLGLGLWVIVPFAVWGWALAAMSVAAYPARAARGTEAREPAAGRAGAGGRGAPEASESAPHVAVAAAGGEPAVEVRRLSRRRFLIDVGGLVAVFIVLGAELGEVLRVKGGAGVPTAIKAPIPFPNAGSPVRPVPGTRPEYTPVAAHYRVDIDLTPPSIDERSWRLRVHGLVEHPLALSLDQIKARYAKVDQFITLQCISNPVGGPLIGTTLWTGARFRDVLADARPAASARWAHLISDDGYDEVVELSLIEEDPRIVLAYDWNGRPLPAEHGFPLRVYVPDRYGMKQPKWITDIVLTSEDIEGYWVTRGWDKQAIMRTTSVVDTVATDALVMRGGRLYVPVGGIAHAGDRGILRVEVKVDDGDWEGAELRSPLSQLTWVIWRYEWPFKEGDHVFSVRAVDGRGHPQTVEQNPTFPAGATGIDSKEAPVLPLGSEG